MLGWLTMRSRFVLTLACCIVVAGSALAATKGQKSKVPEVVGPFLTYCNEHFKECAGTIAMVEVVISFSHTEGQPLCLVPRGVTDDSANHQILAWLEQHDELAGASTDHGVTAAIKGVWNCVAEVPNGKTSNGAPENTGAFLTYCADKGHLGKCDDVVMTASLRAYAASIGIDNGAKAHCSAPGKMNQSEVTEKVLAWLQDHSETHDQDIEDTSATALDNLWPCH